MTWNQMVVFSIWCQSLYFFPTANRGKNSIRTWTQIVAVGKIKQILVRLLLGESGMALHKGSYHCWNLHVSWFHGYQTGGDSPWMRFIANGLVYVEQTVSPAARNNTGGLRRTMQYTISEICSALWEYDISCMEINDKNINHDRRQVFFLFTRCSRRACYGKISYLHKIGVLRMNILWHHSAIKAKTDPYITR